MTRREFLVNSCAAVLSLVLARSLRAVGLEGIVGRKLILPQQEGGSITPLPEITAVVDVLVPADPEIPGDFQGSDYHGDQVVADTLGDLGQAAVVYYLNQYANSSAGKCFIDCEPGEQLEAIKAWVRERDSLEPLQKDMLFGLVTLAMVGTFEENSEEEQKALCESMGWYDPEDPAGTFRVPNEGYPDSFQFPAKLKKGIRNGG